MTLRVKILATTLILGLAGTANAFVARNNFAVQSLPNGQFQVMNRGQMSAPNAWCAAGDFAMGVLGVPPGTPVFRISEPPPPRGANVVFSLSSAGAASRTGLSTIGGSGASMSAVSARNLCSTLGTQNNRR